MENHETMKISIRSILTVAIIAFVCAFSQAQDCVSMYFNSFEDDDDLVVQLKVDNFENIVTTQFAFSYTYLNLELKDLQGNTDINLDNIHFFAQTPGYITVSWSSPVMEQTLPDGSVLMEMRFTKIIDDYSIISLDPNFNTEIIDNFFDEVCWEHTPLTLNEDRTQLVGKLYHDLNGNCLPDPTDLPLSGWTVFVDGGSEKYYRITDAFGYYHVPVELGSYTVQVFQENNLWAPCQGFIPVNVLAAGEVIENSFALAPTNSSSALEVVISSSEIRRCFDNVCSVKYKNDGTSIAQSAKIEILLDDNLEYVSNNTGGFSIDGQKLTFDIGNIKPGDGGDFQIVLNANCDDTKEGQTMCVEANISSNDVVIPPINWGGAVLTTKATCEGDSVAFRIENIGSSPMTNAIQSIVVEDDVMFAENEVELEPQESMTFKHAAFGGVYRVIIDQEIGYPLGSYSTDFTDVCNGSEDDTYQYVSMFQNDDESPYRDIECQVVIDAIQENGMSAFPIGYRDAHLINQNEDIEYTIHFKNEGTDTVNNLFIRTHIDPSLDIQSLLAGSSSHDYVISITEERILTIEFKNIQLMNAGANELASGGFVKFRISQNLNVPLGTIINSTSTIYFDSKDGIATNIVSHQVGEAFIEIILNDEEIILDNDFMVAPNPATTAMKIEVPERFNNISFVLYDTKGRVVSAANTPENVFYIQRGFIPQGMYFLEIRSGINVLGTKKIVFHD